MTLMIFGHTLLEFLQTLLQVMQHLQAEHRQVLHRKPHRLAVHLQHFTIAKYHGGIAPAALERQQCTGGTGDPPVRRCRAPS